MAHDLERESVGRQDVSLGLLDPRTVATDDGTVMRNDYDRRRGQRWSVEGEGHDERGYY